VLILTVTRACDLRCSYCPTAKDGWPSLTPDQAVAAVDLFATRGGGEMKLFGGEPLLVPEVCEAAIEAASQHDNITRVQLSTNGRGLTETWLQRVKDTPKMMLVVSMDGRPEDHRRFRRGPETYDAVVELLPSLLLTPRFVVTMVIPPATARHALENFLHLRSLGIHRFNFLPGYYLPWRAEQLDALKEGFDGIADHIRGAWTAGQRLYVKNLFTRAPTPFFNTGMVVDSDGTIHPSNVGLSGKLDHLREQTMAGTLESPPSPEELRLKGEQVNGLLEATLAEGVWQSTQDVDALLTAFCEGLYPDFLANRRRRRAG
jgi:MoaA/NifB/PqqE/SkfB family radical SAM enzyme